MPHAIPDGSLRLERYVVNGIDNTSVRMGMLSDTLIMHCITFEAMERRRYGELTSSRRT